MNDHSSVLHTTALGLQRGGQTVLDDISLLLEKQGLYGLIGPNGGGKSTLLHVMLGLIAPSSGEISVFGQKPARAAPRIGFVPQAAQFDRGFPVTVRGLVETALLRPGIRNWLLPSKNHAQINYALEATGTDKLADRPLSALSGGELQRALIARALAINPQMMLLDEPTASVDQSHVEALFRLMCDLGQTIPVVVASHDLAQIAAHCTRIFCLNRQLWEAPEGADTSALAAQIFGERAPCRRKEKQQDIQKETAA